MAEYRYRLRDTGLVMLKVDPSWIIRATPEFADIERRLNFPPESSGRGLIQTAR